MMGLLGKAAADVLCGSALCVELSLDVINDFMTIYREVTGEDIYCHVAMLWPGVQCDVRLRDH